MAKSIGFVDKSMQQQTIKSKNKCYVSHPSASKDGELREIFMYLILKNKLITRRCFTILINQRIAYNFLAPLAFQWQWHKIDK